MGIQEEECLEIVAGLLDNVVCNARMHGMRKKELLKLVEEIWAEHKEAENMEVENGL